MVSPDLLVCLELRARVRLDLLDYLVLKDLTVELEPLVLMDPLDCRVRVEIEGLQDHKEI